MGAHGTRSGFSTLLTWFVVGLVVIAGFRLALVLLGPLTRLALLALFTVGPILLVGWAVLRLLRYCTRDSGTTTGV